MSAQKDDMAPSAISDWKSLASSVKKSVNSTNMQTGFANDNSVRNYWDQATGKVKSKHLPQPPTKPRCLRDILEQESEPFRSPTAMGLALSDRHPLSLATTIPSTLITTFHLNRARLVFRDKRSFWTNWAMVVQLQIYFSHHPLVVRRPSIAQTQRWRT